MNSSFNWVHFPISENLVIFLACCSSYNRVAFPFGSSMFCPAIWCMISTEISWIIKRAHMWVDGILSKTHFDTDYQQFARLYGTHFDGRKFNSFETDIIILNRAWWWDSINSWFDLNCQGFINCMLKCILKIWIGCKIILNDCWCWELSEFRIH